MDIPTALGKNLENDFHQQIDQVILESEPLKALHAISVKVVPILWQSYLWMEYDLCEEMVLFGTITTKDAEKQNLLICAKRFPYRSGFQRWTIEWEPDFLFDGAERFQWELINIDKLKPSGAILKWCSDRSFFERIAPLGTPLIQRWIFDYNWEQGLGRKMDKRELEIVLRTSNPGNIVVPLPGDDKH